MTEKTTLSEPLPMREALLRQTRAILDQGGFTLVEVDGISNTVLIRSADGNFIRVEAARPLQGGE